MCRRWCLGVSEGELPDIRGCRCCVHKTTPLFESTQTTSQFLTPRQLCSLGALAVDTQAGHVLTGGCNSRRRFQTVRNGPTSNQSWPEFELVRGDVSLPTTLSSLCSCCRPAHSPLPERSVLALAQPIDLPIGPRPPRQGRGEDSVTSYGIVAVHPPISRNIVDGRRGKRCCTVIHLVLFSTVSCSLDIRSPLSLMFLNEFIASEHRAFLQAQPRRGRGGLSTARALRGRPNSRGLAQ